MLSGFREKGYVIAQADDMAPLEELRQAIFAEAAAPLNHQGDDAASFFDGFHQRGITGVPLNEYRMGVISRFNARVDAGKLVWQAFRNTLLHLAGPDIVVQKSTNLVIAQPGDTSVSPVHRDAPPNSPYEVVVWLPLTHCYGTKGLSLLDRDATAGAMAKLKGETGDYQAFCDEAWRTGSPVDAPFGTAVFFWASLVHAIPVNVEDETRWSLNLRYKNLFTPYGNKGFPDFFRILDLSPLTGAAMDLEKRQVLEGGK